MVAGLSHVTSYGLELNFLFLNNRIEELMNCRACVIVEPRPNYVVLWTLTDGVAVKRQISIRKISSLALSRNILCSAGLRSSPKSV